MTPEQWQKLYDGIEDFDGNSDAWDAFNADLAAMQTPITAEAMLAAGWQWDTQDREYTQTIPQRWTFFYNIEYSCLQAHCWENESSIIVRGLSTMYDLRELVRLLGGAK